MRAIYGQLNRDSLCRAESANSSQCRILARDASSAFSAKIVDRIGMNPRLDAGRKPSTHNRVPSWPNILSVQCRGCLLRLTGRTTALHLSRWANHACSLLSLPTVSSRSNSQDDDYGLLWRSISSFYSQQFSCGVLLLARS